MSRAAHPSTGFDTLRHPSTGSGRRLSPESEPGSEVHQPALPLPPAVVLDACRHYGLAEDPLAWRVRPDGAVVLIAADGRKLIYPPETP
ncbi:MAG: hypothetical protein AB1453_03360 [Chloroflexota bacterium]|jgi:hypothetical protein